MVPISEVAEVADGDGTAPDFDIANRPFARARAAQEVAGVIRALVEADGVVPERLVGERRGSGLEFAA
jgi:hypothetical protein